MAISIPEYNKRLGKVIQQTQNFDNGATMVKLGISAWTFIRGRVIEEGENAEGQKYRAYSTKPMLVGNKSFIKKNVATKFFNRKDLEWRTIGGSSGFAAYMSVSSGESGMAGGGKGVRLAILQGGYRELREMQGRRVDITNFSMTGRMWLDINVRKDGSRLLSKHGDHVKGIAIIGPREELNKKKLAGNTKRFGDILDLNAKEIEDLKLTYKIQELQIFKENGIL